MNESTLDTAIRLFDSYRSELKRISDDEQGRIHALPGYEKSMESARKFADADGRVDLQVAAPELCQPIDEIVDSYAGVRSTLETVHGELVAAAGALNAEEMLRFLRYGEGLRQHDRQSLRRVAALSRNPAAFDYLLGLLDKPSDEIESRPSLTLIERVCSGLFPFLRKMEKEQHATSLALSIGTNLTFLGIYGDARAAPKIQSFAGHPDDFVRKKAQWALNRLAAA